MEELKKSGKLNDEAMKKLDKKYNVLEKGYLLVSMFLKNKIQTGNIKIKNFENKMQQQWHNQLFKNNQSQLYKELSGSINQENTPLNAAGAVKFWENIWSREKEHNREASWLNEVRRTMVGCGQQEDVVVTEEDVVTWVKRSSSWKAAGPDGVRSFWFKTFTSLHSVLSTTLQECLNKGNLPEWMMKGRTVLIRKDPAKGTVASNYRPIVCLSLMWKLLT